MRDGFNIRSWAEEVARKKPEMNVLANSLKNYQARVEPNKEDRDVVALHYRVAFLFPDAVMVTIGIVLMDYEMDFDVVIETMTTLPPERKRQGFGSQAVAKLLKWADERNLSVVAVQVAGEANKGFWTKNGFVRREGPSCTTDFVWHGRLD